jgi:O-antigen ligase
VSQPIIRRRFATQAAGAAEIAVGVRAGTAAKTWSLRGLLSRTNWSIAFVAFMVYTYVVTSYRVPLGTISMATALATIALEGKSFQVPPVARWAIALWVWALIGWPVSEYREVVGNNLLDFAKVCAVLLVAVNVITTRNRLRVFLLLFLGTFALYPVRGALFSYFLYHGTVMGRAAWNFIFSNPNDLAGFCILVFSLVAGVLVTEAKRWIRWCASAGMVVLPFLIVLTGSRSGFIALVAYVLFAFRKQLLRLKKFAALAVVVALIAVLVPSNLWYRIGTIRDVDEASATSEVESESSTAQRLEIWKVASSIAVEHPLLGVGLGAYPQVHFQYAQRPQFNPTAWGHRDAHSTYLRIASELGVVGLVLFCAIVVVTFQSAERARRIASRAQPRYAAQLYYMEMGLAAYLVAGIWASWGTLVFTYLHLAIINVAARLTIEDTRLASAQAQSSTDARRIERTAVRRRHG